MFKLPSSPTLPHLLDLVERAALALLFGYFSWRMLQAFRDTGNIVHLLLLISEGSVLVFVLVRRWAAAVSLRPADWAIAFGGTVLPLLVQPAAGAWAPEALCAALMGSGMAIQIAAKLTLRRSFGVVAANRGVKVGGPYRVVRHPMYAGYLVTQIGFLLAGPSAWNLMIYALALGFQVSRVLAEERILREDEAYRAFTERVPYRLVPRLF